MSNRNYRQNIGTDLINTVLVAGTVSLTGSTGKPTGDNTYAFSSSQTSTGLYRTTFRDAFPRLLACTLTVENSGTQGLRAVISGSNAGGTYSTSGSGGYAVSGLTITPPSVDWYLQTGSVGNPAANPSNDMKVHLICVFLNSISVV